MTFECREHGRVRAIWKKDLRMRAGRHTACPYCARLNFKAWEVVNREKNRARVREWYSVNRGRKIDYERGRREEDRTAKG